MLKFLTNQKTSLRVPSTDNDVNGDSAKESESIQSFRGKIMLFALIFLIKIMSEFHRDGARNCLGNSMARQRPIVGRRLY